MPKAKLPLRVSAGTVARSPGDASIAPLASILRGEEPQRAISSRETLVKESIHAFS
jgi:hypothetical protein